MLLLAAHPRVLLSTDPPRSSVFRASFRSWRFARGPGQPKGAPKGEGLSVKVSYACRRTASRGGSYDGQGEAQRFGLGRQDPRGVDRPGGNDRDHGVTLERSACLCPRVPGGRQRQGRRHACDAPPRSKPVLPLLLPLERSGLDTPCRGGRAGGGAASCGLLLGATLFTQPRRRSALGRAHIEPVAPRCAAGSRGRGQALVA